MSKRILIIIGHPAKERFSFSEVLGNAYMKGAKSSSHEVQILNRKPCDARLPIQNLILSKHKAL